MVVRTKTLKYVPDQPQVSVGADGLVCQTFSDGSRLFLTADGMIVGWAAALAPYDLNEQEPAPARRADKT